MKMKLTIAYCLLLLVLLVRIRCVPTNKKKGAAKPLKNGDEKHMFSHTTLLREDGIDEFDKLPLEESKRRLRIVCERIDTDKDGYLTHDELKKWVENISQRYLTEAVQKYFPEFDINGDKKITWDEHMTVNFGRSKDINMSEIYDQAKQLTFKQSIERDRKRFMLCDQDNNGVLTEDEYFPFFHPEEFDHTIEAYLEEMFSDMDKDKDGAISVEEYIENMWPVADRGEDENEPDWIEDEKEDFRSHKDTNGDMKLDMNEVRNWISPDKNQEQEQEAAHMIANADKNSDKRLSYEEVLDNHELFVNGAIVGKYLKRHEEF